MKPDSLHEPQKLADGVWSMVTQGGSNAGWFLFGDGVIAVDSGNDTSAGAVLSAIDATTGGKKIAFLIVTNNFGPHAGGSPAFAKRGARIVTAGEVRALLCRLFDARAGALRGAGDSDPVAAARVERHEEARRNRFRRARGQRRRSRRVSPERKGAVHRRSRRVRAPSSSLFLRPGCGGMDLDPRETRQPQGRTSSSRATDRPGPWSRSQRRTRTCSSAS